jgi:hypothetical protein
MKAEIIGSNLVITIAMNATPTPSASGKTLIVATSSGNRTCGLQVAGKDVIIGLNAYITR